MPRPTDERARVLGPYYIKGRDKWRLVVIHDPKAERPEDRQAVAHYPTEEAAHEEKQRIEERICNVTVGMAIDAYANYLRHDKQSTGCDETIRRIRLFFPDCDMLLGRITPERGKKWYDAFRARRKEDGDPISVAYHRAVLINSRSMLTWCIDEKRWLRENPLAGIKGLGRRSSGKRVHTADEASRLYAYCYARAMEGDATSMGVLLALALALRSSDVTRRIVRDVDLGGAILRVYDGKTERSNRPRKVPAELQPLLRQFAEGRPPFEPLFVQRRKGKAMHHTRRWLRDGMKRFCVAAGVPYICPHALKGTAGEILAENGASAELIVAHLSHEDGATTRRHYVAGESIDSAAAARGFAVIAGGKR
jgi:integrase